MSEKNLADQIEDWAADVNDNMNRADENLARFPGDERFKIYIDALTFVRFALRDMPGVTAKMQTLRALAEEIDAAFSGQSAFKPMHPPHSRPTDSFERIDLKARAAAAADWLSRNGQSVNEAAKLVAAILADKGVTGQKRGDISASTVKYWRTEHIKLAKAGNLESDGDLLRRSHFVLSFEWLVAISETKGMNQKGRERFLVDTYFADTDS